MADFDLGGLLFGNAPSSGLEGYLDPEQLKRMQQQGVMQAAMALLKASGPSTQRVGLGQALGGAYEAGQAGYQQAQQQGLMGLLTKQKLDEAKRAQLGQQEEATRAKKMQELFPQAFTSTFTPEQQTIYGTPVRVATDDEGNLMPGAQVTPASRQLTIDPNKLQALAMLSKNPLESLSQIAKLVPDLRKAGFTGGAMAQENPFSVFTSDATVPDSLKRIAQQYERSFASGQMDPDKVDDRLKTLAERVQSAAQFSQTQSGIQAQREQTAAQFAQSQAALEQSRRQMEEFRRQGLADSAEGRRLSNQIAQQSLDLRRETEANKPEQFSYSQKKDFDVIGKNLASATNAEDSAAIAASALPLIEQAYSGVFESGAKGLLGAVGISTQAKEANDRLTQLSQQLALKTPKFSGPTSDADAKRYDKAVGDLANPRVSPASKVLALKDIGELATKQKDFAQQQENYFYSNNKSLKGFQYVPSNPFGK